jgi:hypothetical protein
VAELLTSFPWGKFSTISLCCKRMQMNVDTPCRINYYCPKSRSGGAMLTYKVVEVSTVSEDVLEETLNEWTAKGWRFDGLHFAMRESQKRPSMAFVIFTKEEM